MIVYPISSTPEATTILIQDRTRPDVVRIVRTGRGQGAVSLSGKHAIEHAIAALTDAIAAIPEEARS
ncbi:MAG TPA: hypothetical protein VH482_05490 [Thermomicrobiales bacterium]|jgi:hypothetical protein